MLTAGARPKSRTNVDGKALALFCAIALLIGLPMRLGVESLVDRTQMSPFNSETLKTILFFCPYALIIGAIPWRDAAIRGYSRSFALVFTLICILEARHRIALDALWPAALVSVTMFLGLTWWEKTRQSKTD